MCAQVFSAFGFVHKIATFEKASGYQVMVLLYSFCHMSHLSSIDSTIMISLYFSLTRLKYFYLRLCFFNLACRL
jgi:hypothetical protein